MITKRKEVSTGVKGLDQILGGLLLGDNVVWYDESGNLASAFWHRFVRASLESMIPVIFISFDRSPKNLFERLGTMGKNPLLTVLDCFTYGKGKGDSAFLKFLENAPEKIKQAVVSVQTPGDIKAFDEALYSVHERFSGDVHLVFESLTGMQEVWGGEDKVGSFYSHSCPRLYDLSTVAYWIMEKGAHSERLRAQINQIAQVAVELSIKRGTSSVAVIKAEGRMPDHIQQPHPYQIKGSDMVFSGDRGGAGFRDLGARIKQLRSKKGLSQVQMAKLVGVTASTISQVENNSIYPSIPGLLKMAEILNVSPGYLFSSDFEKRSQIVFPAGNASRVSLANLGEYEGSARMMTPLDFEGSAEPFMIEIEPEQAVAGHFFSHRGQEMGFLAQGVLEISFGDEVHKAHAGDLVYLQDQTPTRWHNPGPGTARLFWAKLR